MKYIKKPVVIEAVQWTGHNLNEIKEFVNDGSLKYDILDTAWQVGKGQPHIFMKIHTLEGDHECTKGDYIIKGVKGEFYPCKPDIFKETYDPVEGLDESLDTIEKAKNILIDISDTEMCEEKCSKCMEDAPYDYCCKLVCGEFEFCKGCESKSKE